MATDYDLKITGGSLIDGSGGPTVSGDLAIRDGRIVAVGDAPGRAAKTLDASGRVVAPGFIDIHTHYDAQIFWDRMLTVSPWHGVTSVVMGNCGFGVAPTRAEHRDLILRTLEKVEGMSFDALVAGLGEDWDFESFPEYLDAVEKRGSVINIAAMIGHTPLRLFVMGEESTERAATDEEVARMREIVADALRAGAIGFATSKSPTHVGWGGRPVPSRLAEIDEIRSIANALKDVGAGIIQATAGRGFFLNEMGAIASETGRTFSWTALLAGAMGPKGHRKVLELTAEQQAAGIAVVPQVSCRPLNFEFQWKEPFPFESMKLFKEISASKLDGQMAIYADPDFRARLKQDTGSAFGNVLSEWWKRVVITVCPSDPSLEERTLEAVASERGCHPVDAALDIALESKLEARFRLAIMNTDEEDVAELLNDPHTVLGLSDAGAHASQLCDACFSTHLLGHWVREKQSLSLPQAIHMLTARPAEVFGITDRGRLAPGLAADVVIFDPETVACGPLQRVNDLPANADRLISEAIGIDAVIVNGTLIRRDGKDVIDPEGELPGALLRGGRASA